MRKKCICDFYIDLRRNIILLSTCIQKYDILQETVIYDISEIAVNYTRFFKNLLNKTIAMN